MHLQRLELVDFRGYTEAKLALSPGVRVLVGPNAQGKTNLLEAIHYLAVGGSHRVASDTPLVRAGAPSAVIRAVAMGADARALTVEIELRGHGRNRVQVNGQARRPREAMGLVRSVLFSPEDLRLVNGDPSERRRFLDDLLTQRRPAYLAARLEYERVLRQRNALLRVARRTRQRPDASLATWSDALVSTGATLLAARIAAVHALASPTADAYTDLVATSPEPDMAPRVRADYQLSTGRLVTGVTGTPIPAPVELAEELRAGLVDRADDEQDRGVTLVGPHRDDLVLGIKDLPAKGYASHGEQWSLALALRLASRTVLVEVGEEPIVLLDDVFAELDEHRRRRLALRCARFEQVIVTAAVDADVPLAGPRHRVWSGTVTTDPVGNDA